MRGRMEIDRIDRINGIERNFLLEGIKISLHGCLFGLVATMTMTLFLSSAALAVTCVTK